MFKRYLLLILALASAPAMAQDRPPPPPQPPVVNHAQILSGANESEALVYQWICTGDEPRELTLGYRMAHPRDEKGNSYLDPTWQIERLTLGDSIVAEEAYGDLADFTATLQAIYFVAGRCFGTGAEVRIAGLKRPELGGERVDSYFRVP